MVEVTMSIQGGTLPEYFVAEAILINQNNTELCEPLLSTTFSGEK